MSGICWLNLRKDAKHVVDIIKYNKNKIVKVLKMAVSLVGSKILLAVCNFLMLISGFTLIVGGMLIFFDSEHVLISKLVSPSGPFSTFPHPLLYYVSIGASLIGSLIALVAILGCWASCFHNYYLLSVYFCFVMLILIGECAIFIIAWIWPSCMGLGINSEELIDALQRNYGSENQDQFTNAIDLVQASFHCCGIETSNEYDASYWRLQSSRPSLSVPLTCCKLSNDNDTKSYLNPEPVSSALCQALDTNRHEGFRHTGGCRIPLQRWYRDRYMAFLGIGLVIVLVEFTVLLSSIVTCTRIYHHNQEIGENSKNSERDGDITFERTNSDAGAYSNETYALTGNYKQNYRVSEAT
ncbi:CD151 antigen [Diorhabda sublineata]|uniref:CD151 antigen n=1 Tax=Diorhabda sublineata TaxID=1163346 RepID=UPI0024E04C3D|nr:CD151 antigen [Diorhabda sublineata]